MEIKKEVVDVFKELPKEKRDKFAVKIAEKFSKWDEHRNSQIATARRIMEEVYLNQPKKKFDEGLEWKSDVKLNALYNIKRTKKAALWHEMWSEPQQMFDVKGTNQETENSSKEQKAALVDSLIQMDIGRQYDKSADDLYDIGEMIFKTDWEQRKKVIKRQRKDVGFVLMNLVRNMAGAGYSIQEKLQDIEIPYYENARVESISPFMFVFDHSRFKVGDKPSWDSLIKIYKRFDTLENIKNNGAYTIEKETIEALEKESKEVQTPENKELIDLRDRNEYGSQYSVLYAHGDFKIQGKLYKNYIAEVLAGKYLIRFEENPAYINPFIFCALELDPLTKRGISPLKCVLPLCKKMEELTNTAMDVQMLKANPPCYADETFFDEENTPADGKMPLAPGLIIKIKNTYNGTMPQEVKISGEGIGDLLNLGNQKISDLSSVSNFMYGNVTDTKRTATELSLVDKGASAQTSKELDIINQDLTIPMIKNVAELLAMFKDGVDFVYMQEKGENVEYKITNQIRQAQYNYVYEDRNAIENRKSKFEQLFQMFNSVGQNPELFQMVNWRETITTAIEMLDFENPDKFLNGTSPAEQFAEQLKQIPPEEQERIVGFFAQELMDYQQKMAQDAQQQEMQQQAQNQVEMDMMREQARQNVESGMLQNELNQQMI
ncbi:hypothetical protein IKP85_06630 [bacterium]|nr:hypothetical protein [bacterium]